MTHINKKTPKKNSTNKKAKSRYFFTGLAVAGLSTIELANHDINFDFIHSGIKAFAAAVTTNTNFNLVTNTNYDTGTRSVNITNASDVSTFFSASGSATTVTSGGTTRLTNTSSQKGIMKMNYQFDMKRSISLTGTYSVGPKLGTTSNAQGDGIGFIFQPVDPANIVNGQTGGGLGIGGVANSVFLGDDMYFNSANGDYDFSYAKQFGGSWLSANGLIIRATDGSGNLVTTNKNYSDAGGKNYNTTNNVMNFSGPAAYTNQPNGGIALPSGESIVGGNDGINWDMSGYVAGATVNYTLNWAPLSTTPNADGTISGTITYVLNYTYLGTQSKITFSYNVNMQPKMAAGLMGTTGGESSVMNGSVSTANYTRTSQKTTVNYVDESGNKIAEPSSITAVSGEAITATSPTIPGYSTTQTNLSYTQGSADGSINVVYVKDSQQISINSVIDPSVSINPTFTTNNNNSFLGKSNDPFSVTIPAINGYYIDTAASTLNGFNIVRNTNGSYTITGNYDQTANNGSATDATIQTIKLVYKIDAQKANVSSVVRNTDGTFTQIPNTNAATINGVTNQDITSDLNTYKTNNTPAGYTFVGFVDASDNPVSKLDDTLNNGSATDSNPQTIYAKYTANTNTPYVVNYIDESGKTLKTSANNTGTTNSSLLYDASSAPTIAGYTFLKTTGDTVIKGDGTSVANVVYSANAAKASITGSKPDGTSLSETANGKTSDQITFAANDSNLTVAGYTYKVTIGGTAYNSLADALSANANFDTASDSTTTSQIFNIVYTANQANAQLIIGTPGDATKSQNLSGYTDQTIQFITKDADLAKAGYTYTVSVGSKTYATLADALADNLKFDADSTTDQKFNVNYSANNATATITVDAPGNQSLNETISGSTDATLSFKANDNNLQIPGYSFTVFVNGVAYNTMSAAVAAQNNKFDAVDDTNGTSQSFSVTYAAKPATATLKVNGPDGVIYENATGKTADLLKFTQTDATLAKDGFGYTVTYNGTTYATLADALNASNNQFDTASDENSVSQIFTVDYKANSAKAELLINNSDGSTSSNIAEGEVDQKLEFTKTDVDLAKAGYSYTVDYNGATYPNLAEALSAASNKFDTTDDIDSISQEFTVNYTAHTQTIKIKIYDQTTDALKTVVVNSSNLTGGSDSQVNFTLAELQAAYPEADFNNQGLSVISYGNIPTNFDSNDNVDQVITITVAHMTQNVSTQIGRQIVYTGAPTNPDTVNQTATVNGVYDLYTKDYVWNVDELAAANNVTASVQTPAVDGYTPDQTQVPDSADSQAIYLTSGDHTTTTTVTYAPNEQIITIVYVDDEKNGANVGSTSTVLGGLTGTSFDVSGQVVVPDGYVLTDPNQSFIGTNDANDTVNQPVVVHLSHIHTLGTTTTTDTVDYAGVKNNPPQDSTTTFNWNTDTDAVTGVTTYTPADQNQTIQSPTVAGYTNDRDSVTWSNSATTNPPQNKTVEVTYTAENQTAKLTGTKPKGTSISETINGVTDSNLNFATTDTALYVKGYSYVVNYDGNSYASLADAISANPNFDADTSTDQSFEVVYSANFATAELVANRPHNTVVDETATGVTDAQISFNTTDSDLQVAGYTYTVTINGKTYATLADALTAVPNYDDNSETQPAATRFRALSLASTTSQLFEVNYTAISASASLIINNPPIEGVAQNPTVVNLTGATDLSINFNITDADLIKPGYIYQVVYTDFAGNTYTYPTMADALLAHATFDILAGGSETFTVNYTPLQQTLTINVYDSITGTTTPLQVDSSLLVGLSGEPTLLTQADLQLLAPESMFNANGQTVIDYGMIPQYFDTADSTNQAITITVGHLTQSTEYTVSRDINYVNTDGTPFTGSTNTETQTMILVKTEDLNTGLVTWTVKSSGSIITSPTETNYETSTASVDLWTLDATALASLSADYDPTQDNTLTANVTVEFSLTAAASDSISESQSNSVSNSDVISEIISKVDSTQSTIFSDAGVASNNASNLESQTDSTYSEMLSMESMAQSIYEQGSDIDASKIRSQISEVSDTASTLESMADLASDGESKVISNRTLISENESLIDSAAIDGDVSTVQLISQSVSNIASDVSYIASTDNSMLSNASELSSNDSSDSQSVSLANSDSQIISVSESDSNSESVSASTLNSESVSTSDSNSVSDSNNLSESNSASQSSSDSISTYDSNSISDSNSNSESDLTSSSNSTSDLLSNSGSLSLLNSNSDSISTSNSTSNSKSDSLSTSESNSASSFESVSNSISESSSSSESSSNSTSLSASNSISNSDSLSTSDSTSISASTNDSTSISGSTSTSASQSIAEIASNSESNSISTISSTSDSISNSESSSQVISNSYSNSESQSVSNSESLSNSDSQYASEVAFNASDNKFHNGDTKNPIADPYDVNGDGIKNTDQTGPDGDIDDDGIRNADDPDIDGDGILNSKDKTPSGLGVNDNPLDYDVNTNLPMVNTLNGIKNNINVENPIKEPAGNIVGFATLPFTGAVDETSVTVLGISAATIAIFATKRKRKKDIKK